MKVIRKYYRDGIEYRIKFPSKFKTVSYDFTTTNNLTFVARQNNYTGYGWTSGSGYYSYIQNSSYYRTDVYYSFPSSTYIAGTLKKIRIGLNPHSNYSGGGIAYSRSGSGTGAYYYVGLGAIGQNTTNQIAIHNNSTTTNYYTYNYSSGSQIFVIDFENKTAYVEGSSSTPVSIPDAVLNKFQEGRDNKDLLLDVVANQPNSSGYYSYARSIEFTLI